ncbi:hypothetical protein CPB86DRAFT_419511 [Serendipita vermifera]|nr:hypothetical protein CPB86DRAFT_419511 [Serendipita vermifera]
MNMIKKCTPSRLMTPVTACSSFDGEIIARDGSCVITGAPGQCCEGVHIIPHRRGDNYIEELTRSRADSENDIVRDINDPRNGILLEVLMKRLLQRGDIAFIKTPNFAMFPEDVPRIPEYLILRAGCQPAHLPTAWTMQYFEEEDIAVWVRDQMRVHHNTDLFLPEDLTEWPSNLLLDMLYGCVAMYRWGTVEGIETIRRLGPDRLHSPPLDSDPYTVQPGGPRAEEIDDESFDYARLGDTIDGVVKRWQRLNVQQEEERQYYPSKGFQEKVEDWLRTQ